MKKKNEIENDAGGGDDNDSVWGGDSTWDGGDQDDFSVSVYNAKTPTNVMGKNARPRAVPISRIQIGGPLLPPSSSGSSDRRTPAAMHAKKHLPPSGGKSKKSSKRPSGSGSGFQVTSAPPNPKGTKETDKRHPLNENEDWHESFSVVPAENSDWHQSFGDFSSSLGEGDHAGNTTTMQVKSKAAIETENSTVALAVPIDDQTKAKRVLAMNELNQSFGDLPSFDNFALSSTPAKPTRRRSSREDNSDVTSSLNDSFSLEGFPRAAVPMEGVSSRSSDAPKNRRGETSTRSSRSSDKPSRHQRSLNNGPNDGEKERNSRKDRTSDRSQRRSRSVDLSREIASERPSKSKSPTRSGQRPTSPTSQRRALRRDRSKSPGKFKDRQDRVDRKERGTAQRKERSGRSQSPGKLRNRARDGRSKSPGTLSRRTARRDRSSSPGRLSNAGARRRNAEGRTAPRRVKSDDLNNSLSQLTDKDSGIDNKAGEIADDGRRRRGVPRTKSMDAAPRPRDNIYPDHTGSSGETERRPLRRTRSEKPRELDSALKLVDNQPGSARKSRRRADERSYRSEGSALKHGVESRRVRRNADSKPSSSRGLTLMDEITAERKNATDQTVRLAKEKRRQEKELKRLQEEARLLEEKRLNEEVRLNALKEEARLLEERRKDEEARMKAAAELAKDQREAEASNLREQLEIVREQRIAEEARIARLREEARGVDEEKQLAVEASLREGANLMEENRIIGKDQDKTEAPNTVDGSTILPDPQAPADLSGREESSIAEAVKSDQTESLEKGGPGEHQSEPVAAASFEATKKLRPWELLQARKAATGPQRTASLENPSTDPPAPRRKNSIEARLKKFGSGGDAQLPPAFQMLNKSKK